MFFLDSRTTPCKLRIRRESWFCESPGWQAASYSWLLWLGLPRFSDPFEVLCCLLSRSLFHHKTACVLHSDACALEDLIFRCFSFPVKRLLYPCDTGQFDWKKHLRLSSCRSLWSNRCRPESKQMSYWLRLRHKTPSRFWTDWSILMYIMYLYRYTHDTWLLEILDELSTLFQFFASLKRKALVASRAVTEIRQIYGRWPSIPVRMSQGWSMVESCPEISRVYKSIGCLSWDSLHC